MTQLPHVLKRIRLNLARSKEFPVGSDQHGYEFVAPLDADTAMPEAPFPLLDVVAPLWSDPKPP